MLQRGVFQTIRKQTSTKPKSFPVVEKRTGAVLITNGVNLHSHERTACIRDLAVLIDTKLHFRLQVDNIFSQAVTL